MDKYTNKFKQPITKDMIRSQLKSVMDFPKAGVTFQDISSIIKEPKYMRFIVNDIYENIKNDNIDIVVGLDSRGFILGPMIADKLDVGFGMVRKTGKLPPPYVQQEYDLEYGSSKIAISTDIIQSGMRVHIHDDLLATAGSLNAAISLIESIGADVVSMSVIIELNDLNGMNRLKNYKVYSFLKI